jgi:DNA-binding NtrC family response regulator
MSESKQARLLLVDDEPNVLRALERELRVIHKGSRPAYKIECFASPAAALRRAEEVPFDLVVSDYLMPEMDGVAFLRAFREIQSGAARIILSGQADLKGLIGAINEAGIMRFIAKPWHDAELVFAIENALLERHMLLENQRLADELRVSRGLLSRHEAELRRLEREHPGLTRVRWGEDGSVRLEPEDE